MEELNNETSTIITISDVLEYQFCPRFIYFMHCLDIPQNEEKRYKVLKGREVHKERSSTNREYVRKKLSCIQKESEIYLVSKVNHIKGIVDEVLFLEDGTAAPLEYKFAEYKEKMFTTHKYQLILQALLIMENYNREVKRGYVCYTRSNSLVKEIEITALDIKKAIEVIADILEIIDKGKYPKATKSGNKCIDCCYRNICV